MYSSKLLIYFFCAFLVYTSCTKPQPNVDINGEDILIKHETFSGLVDDTFLDTVYIPIYSSIYNESRFKTSLLTATLSIRNTSLKDSMFISTIDYYNTQGDKVKSFIDQPILMKPMSSLDYVIDKEDDTGGVGANFVITWSANSDIKPMFQAIMIGMTGQHGLSFIVDGISIKDKNTK